MESEIMRYLTQGGAISVLAFILILFIFGRIVSKPTYDKTAETFKESLIQIMEANKESLNQIMESDREGRQELLDLLKSINGRFKK